MGALPKPSENISMKRHKEPIRGEGALIDRMRTETEQINANVQEEEQ